MDLTKQSLKRALGVKSDAELARFFGLTRAAVNLWPDNEPIPRSRQWEVRARRPELFKSQSKYGQPEARNG